jgi:DHA2 family multidrug resistance protein-like MFS transporter
VNLPVVALIVVLGIWVLPEARSEDRLPLDPLSVVYSTAGILGVVYGITELAHSGLGVRNAYVALVAGAGLLWVFLRRQGRLPTPLLDLTLFGQSRFSAAIVAQTVVVFANIGALFFLPIFLRQVGGFSPLQSGLATLPESIVGLITATYVARLIGRWGHRAILLAGMAVGAAGLILLGLAMPFSYGAMVFPLMLLGFSFGSAVTVASDLVLTSASADRVGAATGISETAFELGTALAIAITGSAVAVLYLVMTGDSADLSENVDPHGFTWSMGAYCVASGLLLGAVTVVVARWLGGRKAQAA